MYTRLATTEQNPGMVAVSSEWLKITLFKKCKRRRQCRDQNITMDSLQSIHA